MRFSSASLATLGLLLLGACGDDIPSSDDSELETDTDATTTSSTTLTTSSTTTTTTTTTTSTTSTTTDPTSSTTSTTTDPDTGSSSGSSTGTGTTTGDAAAEIDVQIGAAAVASGDSFEVAETVDVDASGTAVTVTIENLGDEDLDITGVTLGGAAPTHYTLDDAGLSNTLAGGETTTFDVTFTPTNGGLKSADITIDNSDADEGTYVVTLDASTTPNTWRQLSPTTTPGIRFSSDMVTTDDGRIILFGGNSADSSRDDDTWAYDVEDDDWTEIISVNTPPGRRSHAMASLGSDEVLLFGGQVQSQQLGIPSGGADTWIFDASTDSWSEVAPLISAPGRFQHAMVGAGGLGAMFGGTGAGTGPLSDFWVFNRANDTWVPLNIANGPAARFASAITFNGTDTATLYGGILTDEVSTTFDDGWNLNPATAMLTQSAAPTNPGTRFNHRLVYISPSTAIIFGGRANNEFDSGPLAGTFAYDPAADTWTDLAPAAEPPPRFSFMMVAVGENKLIVYGGNSSVGKGGTPIGDSWEYVGPRP